MLPVLAALLALLALLLGTLLLVSPGTPAPFLDAARKLLPGSVSEKIHVEINGTSQGMFIESKEAAHPVLLYVHGGMPDYFLTREHPTGLDDSFTVVWWEQRGSGIRRRHPAGDDNDRAADLRHGGGDPVPAPALRQAEDLLDGPLWAARSLASKSPLGTRNCTRHTSACHR